ncbi:MAG: class I lanthipeptide [Bacteroidetes bacterium]|nr:class I lanthipeptide [Bacteroidota bacterium]
MKKSINKLSLSKSTISNLSAAEMNQQVGGKATALLNCKTKTMTGQSMCFTCSGCPIK